MNREKTKRLDPSIFDLPVAKIKSGFYSDKYFARTREILIRDKNHARVIMQVFPRKEGIVCGIDEAIAILKLCADRPEELKIKALYDGDPIELEETVMLIEGDYSSFAHLETLYLGCLSRRSAIATAVKRAVEAAQGKPILFFSARFDHWSVQSGDGHAALVAGAQGVSTDANALWQGKEGLGTIPHGLIAAYQGDTIKASLAFDRYMPKDLERIVLVDFENDCVKTSLEAAKALGKRLWGVRLDTAGNLRDQSVKSKDPCSFGVCPELVWHVREALDKNGFDWVKIIVSGGFHEEKIREFIRLNVPFDGVGIGSSFFHKRIDFTADIVMVNGKPSSKVGRYYKPNSKLVDV
jgi:nicotinate phosphoribosyltransferase